MKVLWNNLKLKIRENLRTSSRGNNTNNQIS